MQSSSRDAHDRRSVLALVAALVLVVIWGVNFTVQKKIYPVIGPGGFLFVRYLIMPPVSYTHLDVYKRQSG